MKTIFILGLILSVVFCVPQIQSQTADQKQYDKLRHGFSWAKVILNFAELKNMSGGALDDLAEAIANLITDLNNKLDRAHNEYSQRTVEHEADVATYTREIDDANLDISETTEFLDNVLYVQKENLIQTIAELEHNIETTGQYIEAEKNQRQLDHRAYLTKMDEHQDAITAIDECSVILGQLQEEGTFEFVQVSQAKDQVQRVHKKLGNNVESKLVEVLVELASKDFANQQTLKQVMDLLVQVKTNLLNSMAQMGQEEQNAQEAHETDIQNKQAEINRMILEKTDANAQLEQCLIQITDSEEFVAERQQDLQESQQDLDDENQRYQTATENYNALVEQIQKELAACGEALNLIENAGFEGYIGNRVDQDVVIDQPHGTGIQVDDTDVIE